LIVPFCNVQQYARDVLMSLRANARPDFEFILVDDHSEDGTPAILERAAEELSDVSRVRCVRREKNGGIATARNTGLDVAQGEYLSFLDGDDWLAPGYLSYVVGAFVLV
jgi:glycosyltransferase involved in cell wall biosynthesis